MSGNYSAQVALDTLEGVYVKATAIASSAGAWVRVYSTAASLLWFGAIGDGNIANATVNAAALTSALAVVDMVTIPLSAGGFHLGTNTFTVASGKFVIGETPAAKLITTTTTYLFRLTGYDVESGARNLTIDASGAGLSSTIFRAGTSTGVVYRVRFDSIRTLGAAEVFGDEASVSSYIVDARFTNISFSAPRATSIYYRRSRGFMYFENIQHPLNEGTAPINFTCGRFDDAIGLEINRWDVSGGPPERSATATITIASPGVVTWANHGLSVGSALRFTTTGALPTGLAINTTYFVKTVLGANTFTLSATSGGAAINTTGTQSGTHTIKTVPYYQSSGYGLTIVNAISVWLNRVEVDSAWGNGMLLSGIRFLRMNQCSAFGNLGNAIICSGVTESALSDITITGSAGILGDGGGGGLAIDTASQYVGVSNLDINNCTASALILNNVLDISVENYVAYNNTSFAVALLGTTDRSSIRGGAVNNNGGTLLDSASGTKNRVEQITGYNPVGAASVTTSASPYTYTAGRSPETLYFIASNGISAVTQGGVSVLPAALAAKVPFAAQLGPNEPIIITYTGTLTAKKMVH